MVERIADTIRMGKFRAEGGFMENTCFASRLLPMTHVEGGAFSHSVAIS
jgi:hypothetical protein